MIKLYGQTPFGVGTEIDENDYFSGDGTTKTRTLLRKTTTFLGDTIQAGNVFYRKNNGGFITPTSSQFTLNSAPSLFTVIIAPPVLRATFKAYDQLTVPGQTNPNISETELWLADIEDIQTTSWQKPLGTSGISFQMVDKDPDNGPIATWFQLALANPDGTPGSYGSPGAAILLSDIDGYSTTTGAQTAGDILFNVADGTQFQQGGYAFIGDDFTQETIGITTIVGNVLHTTPLANSYLSGTNSFDNGRKVWVKMTVPEDSGGPINWLNIGADLIVDGVSR